MEAVGNHGAMGVEEGCPGAGVVEGCGETNITGSSEEWRLSEL